MTAKTGATIACERCGTPYYASGWRIQRGKTRFCSMACVYATKERRDPTGFLHDNYMPEPNSGCWLWLGPYSEKGYGVVVTPGGQLRAHRLMLEACEPPADPTLLACHRCDVPACINPEHLFWGTPADNTTDALQKNRPLGPRAPAAGERIGSARLTNEAVRIIQASNESAAVLAARFSVNPSAIHRVRRKETWRHVI